MFTKASNTNIHVYRDDPSIERVARVKSALSGALISFSDFDSTSRVYTINLNEIFMMENTHSYYMQAYIESIADDSRGAPEDRVIFSYEINEQPGNQRFLALPAGNTISPVSSPSFRPSTEDSSSPVFSPTTMPPTASPTMNSFSPGAGIHLPPLVLVEVCVFLLILSSLALFIWRRAARNNDTLYRQTPTDEEGLLDVEMRAVSTTRRRPPIAPYAVEEDEEEEFGLADTVMPTSVQALHN